MNRLVVFWKTSNLAVRIIVINVILFLLFHIVDIIFDISGSLSPNELMMNNIGLNSMYQIFLVKPWTLITHMFMHSGVFHLLFNMLMLFFTYRLFTQYFEDRDFFSVYFLSGISGAVLFLLAFNLIPSLNNRVGTIAVGASACVYGTLAAICAYKPEERIRLYGIFDIKLFWLLFIIIALNIINYRSNVGGYWGHFGGIFFGLAFAYYRKRYINIHKLLFPVYHFMFERKRRSPLKVVHRSTKQFSTSNSKSSNEETLNLILDKISKSGYDSLTKEEKRILFDLSKK